MTRPNLVLLGPPHLERDGVVIDVDTRKAIALLAYLAITDRRHARDSIAALLWPEYDQTHARAALRRTLSSINKATANEWLDVERESIGLNRCTELVVDVHELERYLAACETHGHPRSAVCEACVQLLTNAVRLYRDDFMAGFSLRDSAAFDDWQLIQAEHLRRKLASALDRLVHWHTRAAEYELAIEYARRRLALDPLHEATHRTLMHLSAWSGQRSAALQQYRDCVRVLAHELGVEPLPETVELYEAIKADTLPPPPQPARPSEPLYSAVQPQLAMEVSGGRTARPFVGRAAELARLRAAYSGIGADGRLVVVEGVAGIGKTRLVEEFLAQIGVGPAGVVMLRSYPDETKLAFGPIIEGMRAALLQPERSAALEHVEDHWLSEAARLLPELGAIRPQLPAPPPLDSPGAQSRFFEALCAVLLALCSSDGPGLLFFDDVHWADAASLDLLAYLIRRLRGRRVCVIMTWRGEQVPPQHRLRQIVADAQRAGLASVITLRQLDQPAVLELVQAVLSSEATLGEVGARLYHETEGVPLFVMEYLSAIADGALPSAAGEWSLPGGVRDVLRSRLLNISETGRQTLTAAAVIGRSFEYETLKAVSGRSEDETIGALEELFGQSLVEEVSGTTDDTALRYDFSHEKLRSLVYEETSLTRRRVLHRRAAEALIDRSRAYHAGTGRDSTQYGVIANHYRLAGSDRDAAVYFQLAGEHARRLYANADALDHFRTALTLGHPQPAMLHETLGDLLTLQGEYAVALQSYEVAAGLSVPEARAALEHKRGLVHQRRGAWALAEQSFAAALTMSGADGPAAERARILADRSLAARHAGQTVEALEYAQQALQLAQAAGDARALAQAHNIVGILLNNQGDTAAAQRHLRHSLDLADTLGDPGVRAAALNNLALSYQATGAIEQAITLASQALTLCRALGDRHREAALHNNLADMHHTAGNTDAAMQHLKQAVTIYAEIGVEAGAIQPAIWKLSEW